MIGKVDALCSWHDEWWDEHFVDDMFDPFVCAHGRPGVSIRSKIRSAPANALCIWV